MNKTNSQSSLKNYFDYQATTPTDPRVLDTMMPYFFEHFGNPSSSAHAWGWKADAAVQIARSQVAQLIGANPREIIFTSGATESNNQALQGLCRISKRPLITTAIEHKSSAETAHYLKEQCNCVVSILPVHKDGIVDLIRLEELSSKTAEGVVSIIGAHNEIGTLQPLHEISKICRKYGWYFHVDAAQWVGKLPLNVEKMGIDLLSFSGHKMYGPKGIGALYIRRKDPRVELPPLMLGGGQEFGLRSGTLAVPLVVGLGKAAELAQLEMGLESKRVEKLRNLLWESIKSFSPRAQLNGPELDAEGSQRLPQNLNVSFDGVDAQALLLELKGFGLSTSSACGSGEWSSSKILKAIGLTDEQAFGTLRFGLGRWTTEDGVDALSLALKGALDRLKA